MDFELRTVLLILGVIVITAIFLHGLFSIRQEHKPLSRVQDELDEADEQTVSRRDNDGFDCHGVGVARIVTDSDTLEQEQTSVNKAAIDFDVALEIEKDTPSAPLTIDEPEVLFSSPVAQQKPDFLQKTAPQLNDNDDQGTRGASTASAPVNTSAEPQRIKEPQRPQEPMDVLVLNIVGAEGNQINGAVLLPTLLTLGFKFGDMNIFHRHVDASGQGPVLFSLANMVNPGHFDIDNMEQFTTVGVSLFMTLPHDNGNIETFNLMLNAAAKIAEEFDGQVLDAHRSTLTKQSTQQYVQRIRDVERKMLLLK